MKGKRRVAMSQFGRERDYGCHSDPAGEQQHGAAIVIQRKIILGLACNNPITDVELVHGDGAAIAIILTLNRNPVAGWCVTRGFEIDE